VFVIAPVFHQHSVPDGTRLLHLPSRQGRNVGRTEHCPPLSTVPSGTECKENVLFISVQFLIVLRVPNWICDIPCCWNLKCNKPTYTFRILGNIKITKNTNFNSSFSYTSPEDSENTRRSSRSNLSATITQHFMKRKLMTLLSIYDIFEGSKNQRVTSYSNNIISVRNILSPDTRYVSFTVRYNWGKNKRIQRKTSDTDQIGRMTD
jgi:hypothetical protein